MVLAVGLLLLVLLLAAFAVLRRLHLLRAGGAEVVLRGLPAAEGRAWRHGVVRYDTDEMCFYRVASLRPGADRTLQRRTVEVRHRRAPSTSERDVVPASAVVLRLDDQHGECELALTEGALTAFLAWLESAPPGRAQRRGG